MPNPKQPDSNQPTSANQLDRRMFIAAGTGIAALTAGCSSLASQDKTPATGTVPAGDAPTAPFDSIRDYMAAMEAQTDRAKRKGRGMWLVGDRRNTATLFTHTYTHTHTCTHARTHARARTHTHSSHPPLAACVLPCLRHSHSAHYATRKRHGRDTEETRTRHGRDTEEARKRHGAQQRAASPTVSTAEIIPRYDLRAALRIGGYLHRATAQHQRRSNIHAIPPQRRAQ